MDLNRLLGRLASEEKDCGFDLGDLLDLFEGEVQFSRAVSDISVRFVFLKHSL